MENQEQPVVPVKARDLKVVKDYVDSLPTDQQEVFRQRWDKIQDPNKRAEVIQKVIMTYGQREQNQRPSLDQVPQVNADMAQDTTAAGPLGVGAGMMKHAVAGDVPSVVGKLTNAMAGGIPQLTTSHPAMTAMGGTPAALMASASGSKGTRQAFGGEPKTMSGQMAGDALAAIAPALMMKPASKIPSIAGAATAGPEAGITESLEKKVAEVLRPGTTDMQSAIDRGIKLPAIEQGAKSIKKSKNYGELRDNINNVIKDNFKKRADLLANNNKTISSDYTANLRNMIQAESETGQALPRDLKTMRDVLKAENKFLGIQETDDLTNVTPKPTNIPDVLKAQDRKEMLQDLTEKLLERRADGEKVITNPARHKALDALRVGLKEAIEEVVPEVKPINETYDGLREARWLASGQKALADKEVPKNILQRIASYFDNNPAGVAVKVATRENKKLGKVTSDIEGLQAALKNVRKS